MTHELQQAYTNVKQKKATMMETSVNLENDCYIKENAVAEYLEALTELRKVLTQCGVILQE